MKNHTWNKKQITVTLVCCFIILGVVSAEAAYYAPISFLKPAEAYIEVHDTMTAGEIAAELQKKGIISNTWWFRTVATLTGTANTMKQGEYLVNSRMSLHGSARSSLVGEGSQILGTVIRSVVFYGVTIEEGAKVTNSVLMPGTSIEKNAVVDKAIIGERCIIQSNAVVHNDDGTVMVVGNDEKIKASEGQIQGDVIACTAGECCR